MFYQNYVRLCNSVGKTPSAVALELGIQKSTVTRWSDGSTPRDATIIKVADYFGVTVSELISEQKEKPVPEIGNELDAETMELLEIWNSIDQDDRDFLIANAKMLKARREKK